MISDAITLIEFLQKHKREYQTKSALFTWDGTRKEGSNQLEVQIIKATDARVWFYKVKELEGFVFVYSPVIPTLYIDYGQLQGSNNPQADVFRFVGNPLAKFTSGGEPNVKADFIVVAYRPKDFLGLKEING
jgi:hypothetical protein